MTQLSVDADAQQQLLHELRQFRDAEQAPHTLPDLRLRKGVITARDPATYTVTVLLGAADESDLGGEAVAGIRLADTVYPFIGAVCFVAFNGPDPTVLYTIGKGVGSCRAWRNVDSSPSSGIVTPIPLNVNNGTSGTHSNDSMHTLGDPEIYCVWPGHYRAHGNIHFLPVAATGWRAFTELFLIRAFLGGTDAIIARTDHRPSVANQNLTQEATATDFVMAAGDAVQLRVLQSSGTTSNMVVSAAEFSPILELTWTGPPY